MTPEQNAKIIELFKQQLPYADIAVAMGTSTETIRKALRKQGYQPRKPKVDQSQVPLMADMVREGRTSREIAARFNMSIESVRYRLARYADVHVPAPSVVVPDPDYYRDVRPRLVKGLSYREIADQLGCTKAQVLDVAQRGRLAARCA